MPGTFSPPVWFNDPDMHHGTWCQPGSLTSGFLWSRWRRKRSRHSRRMRNRQFYVSGKRPMEINCIFVLMVLQICQIWFTRSYVLVNGMFCSMETRISFLHFSPVCICNILDALIIVVYHNHLFTMFQHPIIRFASQLQVLRGVVKLVMHFYDVVGIQTEISYHQKRSRN